MWRDQGRGDRDWIVAHLAACGSCRHLAAELERVRPLEKSSSRLAANDFVTAGYRAGSPRTEPGRTLWRSPWPLATAALAAAALLVVWLLPSRVVVPAIQPDDTVRGASIQLLAPTGPSAPPIQFRWASPFAADRFVLEVLDPNQRVVYSTTVTGERASSDARDLKPGVQYAWRVTALSSSGRSLMQSALQTFSVGAAR